MDLVGEVGLDRDEARAVLTGDRYADAVREDLSLARAFGIDAVPFFVIDRKYGIAGAQEAAVLREALEKAWAEEHPLTMVAAARPEGAESAGDDEAGSAGGDEAGNCADGVCRV